MSSSPEARVGDPVLRGTTARDAAAARFAVDLRSPAAVDSKVVEQARTAGRTAGYAEGWGQGQRAAAVAAQADRDQAAAAEQALAARRSAALQQAVAALAGAADDVQARTVATVEQVQDLIIAAAVELAEAILGRELAEPADRGADALRRAMRVAPSTGTVRVRLHPDDYQNLCGSATDGDYNYEGRPVILRPDPGLRPGDAMAEVGSTTVDASIAAALNRAREVLDL